MSRRLKVILAVVALLVVAGAVAFFVLRAQASGPVIETATATKTTLGVTVSASGEIGAGLHEDIYPPTQGTLDKVFVKDGQQVKAGQKIAVMDTDPLELAVEQAKAALSQAQAQVSAAEQAAPSSSEISAAKSNVTATSAAYNAAKIAYSDSVQAYNAAKAAYEASRTISNAAALLQARTAKAQADAGVDQAKAAYKGAQSQYEKLQRTSTTAQLRAGRAGVAQAQDALAIAEEALDNATFVAPFDGVVFFNATGTPGADGEVPRAQPGAAVSPAFAPFSVVDLGASDFTAQVDEADIARVENGMTASITLDAFPGKEFKSKVARIGKAAQATATGGTIFPVDLEMTDMGENLLLGMKGDASIEVSAVSEAVVIPVEALFNENGENFVYLVENGKLKKKSISVGATTETQVQVIKGLKPGQVVALSGPTQYTDGMAVRVK